MTALTDKIVALDPTVPELPFKDVNFRIYRDIRFSHDPTPYKVYSSSFPTFPPLLPLHNHDHQPPSPSTL